MRYLVMECHTSYAVLLDECGCFVRAANLCYQVGETVEEPVLLREKTPVNKRAVSIAASLAVAAACLLFAFMGYHQDYRVSYTSIYLTINPSICMELNRRGDVIKVTGANEDGMHLLEGYTRSSSDRLTVTNELIERAIDMGYLSEGGQVIIDIDAPYEIHFKLYGVELRSDLAEYLENRLTVEVQIISHDEKKADSLPEEKSFKLGKTKPQDTVLPSAEPPSDHIAAVPDSGAAVPNMNKTSGVSQNDTPDSNTDYGKDYGTGGDTNYGKDSYSDGDTNYGKDSYSDDDTDYEKDAGRDESSDYKKDSDYGESSDYEKDTGYDESSDYKKDSDYGESSDYEKDAGHDGSSDYKKGSDYEESSDYEKD